MMPHRQRIIFHVIASGAAVLVLTGCQGYLAFSTATTFGLDVSQRANESPHVVMGYKRAEVASLPASQKNATEVEDTYSVLGTFCASYDPNLSGRDSLQIRSVFTTGMAARKAAGNKDMQKFFAGVAFQILAEDEQSKTKCF